MDKMWWIPRLIDPEGGVDSKIKFISMKISDAVKGPRALLSASVGGM
jgi:hypothetical protein